MNSELIEVGALAHEALQDGSRGRVVAVFDRSFYAVLDDRWICVGSRELGSGPLHVLCGRRLSRRPTLGSAIVIVSTTVWVEGKPFARFDSASVWKPERPPNWTVDSIRKGLAVAEECWNAGSVGEGLTAAGCVRFPTEVSPVAEAARPGVMALNDFLNEGLRGCAPAPANGEALARLIGLGPGLTPSGDDLLGGALIALAALGFLDVRDLLWEVCRVFLVRTNEVSRAHLRAAARGYGAAALHAATHATMGGRAELVEPALSAVSRIGQTSGRDAFAGVLIVLRAVERRLESANAGFLIASGGNVIPTLQL